jgi:chromosome segregation ATPase
MSYADASMRARDSIERLLNLYRRDLAYMEARYADESTRLPHDEKNIERYKRRIAELEAAKSACVLI